MGRSWHSDKLSPPRGQASDLIERLTAYVNRVDPSWRTKLEPARLTDLERLSQLAGLLDVGLELPESYRRWAMLAGADDGGLLSTTLRAWVSVADMVEHYGELHKFEPELINPRLLVVVNEKIGDDFSLDLREPDAEPSVRETSGGEDLGLFSTSWEALLFQCAVEMCEKQRLEGRRLHGSSPANLRRCLEKSKFSDVSELVAETLAGEGFELPWFNDSRHVYGLGADVSVFVNISLGGSAPVTIVGRNSERMRRLGETLTAALGVEPAVRDQWR